MKELILVRHAKSSWSNPGLADRDRPLNKRGNRDAPIMASFLRSKNIIPDILKSSPANRAYSTAEYFSEEFESELKDFEKYQDLYFGSENDWLFLIQNTDEKYSFPVFFSHNPTITYFSNQFTENYIENVPTCGVIHLKSEADYWKDLSFHNTKVIATYFPKLIDV